MNFFVVSHFVFKNILLFIRNFCNSKFKFEIYGHEGSLLGSSHSMDVGSVVDISEVLIASVVRVKMNTVTERSCTHRFWSPHGRSCGGWYLAWASRDSGQRNIIRWPVLRPLTASKKR